MKNWTITQQKFVDLIKSIKSTYGTKEFQLKDFTPEKVTEQIAVSSGSKVGIFKKIRRGVYSLNKDYLDVSDIVIANKIYAYDKMKLWNKKQDLISVSCPSEISVEETRQPITVEFCIMFLKSKGYKILAPVTEFKEV